MGVFYTGDRYNLSISEHDAERLLAMLQEYLGCFRLYGIDMNGNEIILYSEGSGMETRALSHFVSEIESYGGIVPKNTDQDFDLEGGEEDEEF